MKIANISINKNIIEKLNPHKDIYDNFLKHYSNKTFTKQQFMGLKKITHQDKLWVAFRLMPKESIKLASADIAESVLPIYENVYPKDLRPRKAIEIARSSTASADVYADAYAAATAALTDAYLASDDQTSSAAAHAASAATAAYAASVSSAASAAAYAAAYAAYSSVSALTASNRETKQKEIRKIIMKHWR